MDTQSHAHTLTCIRSNIQLCRVYWLRETETQRLLYSGRCAVVSRALREPASGRPTDRQTDRPAGLPADCTWTQPPSRRRLRRLCSAPQTPARPSSGASILGLNLHVLAAPTHSRFYGTPFIQKTSHPFANVIRILPTLFTILRFARLFQTQTGLRLSFVFKEFSENHKK